jgi:hypothetical protein
VSHASVVPLRRETRPGAQERRPATTEAFVCSLSRLTPSGPSSVPATAAHALRISSLPVEKATPTAAGPALRGPASPATFPAPGTVPRGQGATLATISQQEGLIPPTPTVLRRSNKEKQQRIQQFLGVKSGCNPPHTQRNVRQVGFCSHAKEYRDDSASVAKLQGVLPGLSRSADRRSRSRREKIRPADTAEI